MANKQELTSNTSPDSMLNRLSDRVARRILIVAVPPIRALDVFGPAEVFGDANRLLGGAPAYKVEIVSAGEDRTLISHLGTWIRANLTYSEVHCDIDTFLVAGGIGASEMRYTAGFLHWLKKHVLKARRFGSICTGSLILAEAGLLNGCRATTHWNWCNDLEQKHPQITVDANPIYVQDGNCYTSAGVTAGIDLALALVERPWRLRRSPGSQDDGRVSASPRGTIAVQCYARCSILRESPTRKFACMDFRQPSIRSQRCQTGATDGHEPSQFLLVSSNNMWEQLLRGISKI